MIETDALGDSTSPSVITETEWAVHLVGDLGRMGREVLLAASARSFAERRLAHWRRRRPDVTATLMHRQVVTARGEWRPAPGSGDDVRLDG